MSVSLSAQIARKFGVAMRPDDAQSKPAAQPTPAVKSEAGQDVFVRGTAKPKALGAQLSPELLRTAQRYFGAVKAFAK